MHVCVCVCSTAASVAPTQLTATLHCIVSVHAAPHAERAQTSQLSSSVAACRTMFRMFSSPLRSRARIERATTQRLLLLPWPPWLPVQCVVCNAKIDIQFDLDDHVRKEPSPLAYIQLLHPRASSARPNYCRAHMKRIKLNIITIMPAENRAAGMPGPGQRRTSSSSSCVCCRLGFCTKLGKW